MKIKLFIYLLALSFVVLSAPAMADAIIYDNGDLGLGAAISSDIDVPVQLAADFVLGSSGNVITGVNWWGGMMDSGDPLNQDFTILFFTDNAGTPSSTAFASYVVTDASVSSSIQPNIYSYSASIPSLTLTAGETYYVSILNSTTDAPSTWCWAMNSMGDGGTVWYSLSLDNAEWADFGVPGEFAFNFTGTSSSTVVPEPATMSLLGLGLAGLVVRRFRKRA